MPPTRPSFSRRRQGDSGHKLQPRLPGSRSGYISTVCRVQALIPYYQTNRWHVSVHGVATRARTRADKPQTTRDVEHADQQHRRAARPMTSVDAKKCEVFLVDGGTAQRSLPVPVARVQFFFLLNLALTCFMTPRAAQTANVSTAAPLRTTAV